MAEDDDGDGAGSLTAEDDDDDGTGSLMAEDDDEGGTGMEGNAVFID
jgi:hypothetical protein